MKIKRLPLNLIRFYRKAVSPYLGRHCRFYPSCSQYFQQALKKYGFLKGGFKGVGRILRCHPWSRGGIDFP